VETITAQENAVASYNLGSVQRIPLGEGRVYRVRNTEVAIFRTRTGQVYATQARCPHRAGPLADGLIGAGKVVCPLHGYVFELETGLPVESTCAHLRTYPVALNRAGEIVLTVAE
jgi:nitrite reductase (NADH) small subunit